MNRWTEHVTFFSSSIHRDCVSPFFHVKHHMDEQVFFKILTGVGRSGCGVIFFCIKSFQVCGVY